MSYQTLLLLVFMPAFALASVAFYLLVLRPDCSARTAGTSPGTDRGIGRVRRIRRITAMVGMVRLWLWAFSAAALVFALMRPVTGSLILLAAFLATAGALSEAWGRLSACAARLDSRQEERARFRHRLSRRP